MKTSENNSSFVRLAKITGFDCLQSPVRRKSAPNFVNARVILSEPERHFISQNQSYLPYHCPDMIKILLDRK